MEDAATKQSICSRFG